MLAYSGGLDTSIILKWLQETYGCEVITFTADLGQGEELEPARAKAEQMGVKQVLFTHTSTRYRIPLQLRISHFTSISQFLTDVLVSASQIYIDDLREEFVRDYVFPMFRANAIYEGTYLLGTSIARPLISKQIEIAKGYDAVCRRHGKGNTKCAELVPRRARIRVIAPCAEGQLPHQALACRRGRHPHREELAPGGALLHGR